MSWREFSLRCTSFKRQSIEKWKHTREVAFYSLIGANADPKKLPKSIEQFMPLQGDKKRTGVSDAHKEAFLRAYKKYADEQQSKLLDRGGTK